MKYVNQLEYAHIPYPTRVKQEEYAPNGLNTSVRQSGCGLCSVCMAIDIITDKTLDIEECVRISCECVANHSRGTDMNILGPVIAEAFDIEYTKTSDLSEAIAHLQAGGVIVVHVGIPEGKEITICLNGYHFGYASPGKEKYIACTHGKMACLLLYGEVDIQAMLCGNTQGIGTLIDRCIVCSGKCHVNYTFAF